MKAWANTKLQAGIRSLSVAQMLAVREFAAELRVSRMSVVWPVLYPLLYAVLLVLIRPYFGSASQASPLQYGVFVFVGMCLWQSWIDSLRRQMGAIRANKSMVTRGELGIFTLFVNSLIYAGIEFAIKAIVIIPAALLIFPVGPMEILIFLAASVLLVLNGTLVGTVLQPFATLSPDLGKFVQTASLALLLSGAVFIPLPLHAGPTLLGILGANPMGALLNLARAPLLGGDAAVPMAAFAWGVLTLAILPAIPRIGRRVLPIVIERLGN